MSEDGWRKVSKVSFMPCETCGGFTGERGKVCFQCDGCKRTLCMDCDTGEAELCKECEGDE